MSDSLEILLSVVLGFYAGRSLHAIEVILRRKSK